LHVDDSDSLKSKRKVVRSLKDSIRRRFGASVAEIGGHDSWQRATLLVGVVGGAEVVERGDAIQRYLTERTPGAVAFERHLRSLDDLR
jgi:uncharacterized protein YlxP (DUF503 family)